MTDPITQLAEWLASTPPGQTTSNLEWMRHRPEVAEFLDDVDASHQTVLGIARGPADRRYLGPCGAPQVDIPPEVAEEQGIHPANAALGLAPCDGEVYARSHADTGYCQACGTAYPVKDRLEWLDEQVAVEAFPAKYIADAYDVRANTIRVWADRNQLRTYYRHEGRLVEWTKTREGEDVSWRGPRLYMLAEVLERMREAAVHKAEQQAARARRKPRRRKEDAA